MLKKRAGVLKRIVAGAGYHNLPGNEDGKGAASGEVAVGQDDEASEEDGLTVDSGVSWFLSQGCEHG